MLLRPFLGQWQDGLLTSRELMEAFAEQETKLMASPAWLTERRDNFERLTAALDVMRLRGGGFRHRKDLRRFVKRFIESQVADEAIRERSGGYVSALSAPSDLEYSVDAHAPAATHQPSESEQVALRKDLPNLSVFTALPSNVPKSMQGFARIIALRVFGGWSLERIAEHDGVAVETIADLWAQARAWVHTDAAIPLASASLLTPIDARILTAIQDAPQLLHVLEWRPFERLLAKILESLGYEVELQRGTKDGGIDIVALRQDAALGPHRYLLQAKRTTRRIGVEPVRELLFLKANYHATKACLATTSSFTAGAWQLAREHRWELELRDYERLQQWLEMIRR